jgi:putative membrane protein
MTAFGVRVLLAVIANAVALLLAAVLLDGVEIRAGSFVVAVAIFSIASLVVRPVAAWIVIRRLRPLIGVVALVTTFAVLLITDLLSDGVSIDGPLDWILATVIVWLATLAYDIFDTRLQRLALRGIRDDAAAGRG